jgi:hypothetical protein
MVSDTTILLDIVKLALMLAFIMKSENGKKERDSISFTSLHFTSLLVDTCHNLISNNFKIVVIVDVDLPVLRIQ